MLRWLQLLSLVYLLKCAHLLEENGEGVCNRTDIQTQLITVNQTIIVGTTEVPCTINSWLDQISCSNNVQIQNVTRTVQKTMLVANPVVTLFCCPGFNLVEGNCKIITTTSTTSETTMPTTEATTTATLPTTETTTLTTTEATTTATLPTTETTTLTTTEAPLPTTTLPTTQATTTATLPTTEATTKFETTPKLEIIATTGEHTDENTRRQFISTKPKHTITTVDPDSIVDDEDMSSGDVDVPDSPNPTIVTENDVYFTKVDETIPDSGVAPENRPDDSNIRDIMLYVFASFAVLFLVIIVTIICVYKRRSKKKSDRSNVVVTLAMDDIISNGNRVTTMHQNSCYTEMNENSQNQYTELKHKEDPDYDEIKHVAEQEDHYEKLPGYDESSASPNMNGLMFEYDYEKPVVNLKTK